MAMNMNAVYFRPVSWTIPDEKDFDDKNYTDTLSANHPFSDRLATVPRKHKGCHKGVTTFPTF